MNEPLPNPSSPEVAMPADPLDALNRPADRASGANAGDDSPVHLELPRDLQEVDQRIARLALLCKVRLLERPVLQRVLDNDASVCGAPNERAFVELRGLLGLHFKIQDQLTDELTPQESARVIAQIHDTLRARLGPHLAELE